MRTTAVDVHGFAVDVLSVVTGERHSCARTRDGRVYCWGANADRGQLGPLADGGPDLDVASPREIQFLVVGGATLIAAGALHTCAVQALGEVWCWGDNQSWQVSLGAAAISPAPTPVLNDVNSGVPVTGAFALAAGGAHTCMVSAEGLRCWGSNDHGQLGDGPSLVTEPTAISLDGGVTTIAAGRSHTCASSGDSTWCWGANGSGQLGDDTGKPSRTPVLPQLPSGSKVVGLSAGGDTTCAVTADRALWCWGDNTFGQVGDGSNLQRSAPVKVLGLTENIRSVSVGNAFTCAVSLAGKAYCWGRNTDGQLGDGTDKDRNVPGEVQGL